MYSTPTLLIGSRNREDRSKTDLPADAVDTPQLIDALMQPEAFTRLIPAARNVTLLQTHISLLFFVDGLDGGRVYKVKKPVDLGFLDFTTLEARRHFCHEEVRLNRRLAPDVYLGVQAIVRDRNGRIRLGEYGDDEVIDFAVEMIRLPAERMLSELLAQGQVDNATLRELAKLLAEFHRTCPTGEGVDEHASPRSLRSQVEETLTQLEPFIGTALSPVLHTSLRRWCEQFLTEHESLLKQRIADGRIREGHGDLHSENICILPDRIVIYDCIEFTPRFRCRDVACELAFVAMDLDARSSRSKSECLIREYAALTSDETLSDVLPLYKVYLALVRAKVNALKSTDESVSADERQTSLRRAAQYAQLAATYLIGPAMMVMCGLPGSGKSWAARAAAEPFEATVLRSDVIRKQLAGLDPYTNAAAAVPHVYSPAYTQRTYAAMLQRARDALQQRRTVLADATFSSQQLRQPFFDLAKQLHIPRVLLHTHAPPEEIRRRMDRRRTDAQEVSDADWAVYERAAANWQDPSELPADCVVRIEPGNEPHEIAAAAIDALLEQTVLQV